MLEDMTTVLLQALLDVESAGTYAQAIHKARAGLKNYEIVKELWSRDHA